VKGGVTWNRSQLLPVIIHIYNFPLKSLDTKTAFYSLHTYLFSTTNGLNNIYTNLTGDTRITILG
jgi:hypothetical protein